jgi:signal transduction histidine kinase
MTLLRRILLFYCATLGVSLLIVAAVSWMEFHNQIERMREGGIEAVTERDGPLEEAIEIVLYAGLPATLIGLASGLFFMRRALRPIQRLTDALERTDVNNLAEPVPRSGNGDELDRMTVVFNSMKKRLGASFTQAREFTLHASHELKTPLTILHGTLEQMLEREPEGSEQRDKFASMIEEVQRLSHTVGQLAFLARADAGQMALQKEEVALDELMRELVEETIILAGPRGIAVKLGECQPCRIKADRMRLRQLLLNLADNAVKHNREGGRVEMSLTCQGGSARVSITNTGPVLPPVERARVFERFFCGDPAHGTGTEGSGLGLSIAQSIVEAHGGAIEFESEGSDLNRVTVSL